MKIRTIENLDVRGKYVLLRDDFNVQIVDGKIKDSLTARIEALFNWFVGQYNEIK